MFEEKVAAFFAVAYSGIMHDVTGWAAAGYFNPIIHALWDYIHGMIDTTLLILMYSFISR